MVKLKASVCTLLAMQLFAIPGPVFASAVRYPLAGHFESAEGTIELWFAPACDFQVSSVMEFTAVAELLSFRLPSGSGATALIFSKQHQLYLSFSMHSTAAEGAFLPIEGVVAEPLTRGTPQHLAFTWHGRTMRTYLNGHPLGERKQVVGFEQRVGAGLLTIGPAQANATPVIIRSVRTSNVARTEDEVLRARPVLDTMTLLLDHFGRQNPPLSDSRTRALLTSGLTGEYGGIFEGTTHYVETPLIRGLALFDRRSDANACVYR